MLRIDIADIAELATPVAMHGSIGSGDTRTDDIFAIVAGVVALVVATSGK